MSASLSWAPHNQPPTPMIRRFLRVFLKAPELFTYESLLTVLECTCQSLAIPDVRFVKWWHPLLFLAGIAIPVERKTWKGAWGPELSLVSPSTWMILPVLSRAAHKATSLLCLMGSAEHSCLAHLRSRLLLPVSSLRFHWGWMWQNLGASPVYEFMRLGSLRSS